MVGYDSTGQTDDPNAAYLFEADFDNFELHKVRTTPPMTDKN
jgi:hypothetical protein